VGAAGLYDQAAMRTRIALALVAALAVTGCGASVPKLKRADRGSVLEAAAQRPPIGPPRSPQQAVLKLWAQLQHESYLTAVYDYDPRVRKAFPIPDLIGSLALIRAAFLSAPPQITDVEKTPVGSLVYTQTTMQGKPVGFSSYLVKKTDKGWRITYDSTLHDALVSYTQQRIEGAKTPGTNGPSTEARAAGDRVGRKYLLLFAPKH
jgi:hypothetical protein